MYLCCTCQCKHVKEVAAFIIAQLLCMQLKADELISNYVINCLKYKVQCLSINYT